MQNDLNGLESTSYREPKEMENMFTIFKIYKPVVTIYLSTQKKLK